MKVLDCYAGTGSATEAFYKAGHDVRLVEIDESLIDSHRKAELIANDMKLVAQNPEQFLGSWKPDFIWLSPPCQSFSMAGSGSGKKRWQAVYPEHALYGPRIPISEVSKLGCELVLAGLELVQKLQPKYWLMENPTAGLRTMGFMQPHRRWSITYCQYWDTRMKPTDLWGVMPNTFQPFEPCKNGDGCHVSAPRGSKTPGSTQGIVGSKDRGRVPIAFSQQIEICLSKAL